jgi:hypothetical protein
MIGANQFVPVRVVVRPSVIAQTSNSFGKGSVVRNYRARIAKGSEVLARVKAEASCVGEAASSLSSPTSPVRLRSILNDSDPGGRCRPSDGVHVGRLTEQMNGNHRSGPSRNCLLEDLSGNEER